MRRLLLLASAVVFVDTMFTAAITPLLPYFQDHIGLSKADAGLLVAAYPAGTLAGAIPGGWMASRLGVKPVVLIGLALMAVSTFVFGFAHSELVLDLSRFVQGVGGAFSWVGMMSWLVTEAPRDRRGEMIGTALGAAIVGALFGPVVGSLAIAVGLEVVFSGVVVLAAGLSVWAVMTPAAPAQDIAILSGLRAARRSLRVRGSLWLVLLPSLIAGVYEVLMPLRLDQLGAAELLIGGVFVVAAGVEALASPLIGRLSDRRGRLVPIRFGLMVAPVVILALAVPRSPWVLAVVIVVAWVTLGTFWSPAMAALSDAADDAGVGLVIAWALSTIAWAGGQVAGSAVGGAVAAATADIVPYAFLAGLCLLTLAGLGRLAAPHGADALP